MRAYFCWFRSEDCDSCFFYNIDDRKSEYKFFTLTQYKKAAGENPAAPFRFSCFTSFHGEWSLFSPHLAEVILYSHTKKRQGEPLPRHFAFLVLLLFTGKKIYPGFRSHPEFPYTKKAAGENPAAPFCFSCFTSFHGEKK